MKFVKIIIILLTFCSCSKDKYITEFEIALGSENSYILTELVNDFETDFLKSQYPKLKTKDAYKKFLSELLDDKTVGWKKISESTREKFANSSLKDEVYLYPDSVWIEKDTSKMTIKSKAVVKSRFKYINNDGSIDYLENETPEPPMKNFDINWVLEKERNSPRFNSTGKYLKALYQIKDRDTFFKNFYQRKEAVGLIRPEALAKVMLHENIDLTDYLVKRIIVLEMAY